MLEKLEEMKSARVEVERNTKSVAANKVELVQHRIYDNLVDEIQLNIDTLEGDWLEIKFLECQCKLLKEHFVTLAGSFEVEVFGRVYVCTVHDNCVEVIWK